MNFSFLFFLIKKVCAKLFNLRPECKACNMWSQTWWQDTLTWTEWTKLKRKFLPTTLCSADLQMLRIYWEIKKNSCSLMYLPHNIFTVCLLLFASLTFDKQQQCQIRWSRSSRRSCFRRTANGAPACVIAIRTSETVSEVNLSSI